MVQKPWSWGLISRGGGSSLGEGWLTSHDDTSCDWFHSFPCCQARVAWHLWKRWKTAWMSGGLRTQRKFQKQADCGVLFPKKECWTLFLGVGCFKLQLFPSFFRSQIFQLLGGHLRRFLFPNLFLSFFRKISGFSREKLWGLLNIWHFSRLACYAPTHVLLIFRNLIDAVAVLFSATGAHQTFQVPKLEVLTYISCM